jgi:predicted secreted protein
MSRFAALCLTLALAAPAAGQVPGRDAEGFTVLALTETVQRDVRRDRLKISLRAEDVGGDPAAVQAAINRRVAAAVERARKVAGVRVETGGYWVGEERAAGQPVRWRGSQTLTLTAADATPALALAGQLQSGIISDGPPPPGSDPEKRAWLASGMSWELTPESARKAEDALTAEALRRLRARAETVAKEMNLQVARFARIGVGEAAADGPTPMPRMRAAPMAATAVAAPPVVAEPGDQTVSVTVSARVLLKPR